MNNAALATVRQQLAPKGTLRAALNMSNFLLVSTSNSNGEPEGVAPSMARAIADKLGVPLQLIPYQGPGQIADAANIDEWDIATIAAEPERARLIRFTPAYCEIQATYLVPPDSPLKNINDVDQPGTRIAVKERAAYDLWLTGHLQHATLHRAESLDASFELFRSDNMDALAGLRPKLLEQQLLMPGSVLFEESFTAVQQSIGCKPGYEEAAAFLAEVVESCKTSGHVAQLINQFGVTGKLSI